MAIKPNKSDYDALIDNPLVASLFNYNAGPASFLPPPAASYMITEIAEDFMQMELTGDLMITEF